MSHFDTVRPNGVWGNEMVPTQADFERWDVTQSALINGDNGGNYAPTSPIIIGGAGLSLGANGFIGGGVTTELGGYVMLGSAPFDFPRFSSTRSRFLQVPLQPFVDVTQPLASIYFPLPSRYTHDRSLLNSLFVWYAFTQKPTSLSITPPHISLVTYRNSGFQDATAPGDLSPVGANVWTSGNAYALGAYVIPSTIAKQNNRYFKCTVAGTANTPEPAWPTTIGTTVTDGGGVQWTCTGRSGGLPILGSTPDSLFNKGLPQVFTLDFDTAAVLPNTIDLTTHGYAVKIANLPVVANPLLPQQSTVYPIRIISINVEVSVADMTFP